MTGRRSVLLIAVLVLSLAGPPAAAVTTPSDIDPRLRLEWDASQSRDGRPMVTGYIYNDYGRPANNVRLVVETLDGSGRVTDRAFGFVRGIVPGFNRSYWVVPVKTPGASYRVTVTSFEWRDGA